MALAKKFRLKNKNDFDSVFKKGKTIKGPFLLFKIKKNNLGNARIGITIPLKVSKKATVRNSIKRKINSSINTEKIQNNHLDIIIIAIPSILDKNRIEIKREINQTLNKIFGQVKHEVISKPFS